MIHHQPLCNDDLLREMLRGDTDGQCDPRLLEHIETCPRCQQRLDELAADGLEWTRAADVLSSNARAAKGEFGEPSPAIMSIRPVVWTESLAKDLLSPPSHPEMLGRIGRYEVERLIGCGGMGVVFRAHDTELNRPVAVKLLAPYLASSGAARKRFAREARAAAGVVDDHVVPIHNVESENEPPFLVMQYVAGGSLQEKLDRHGPLEVAEVVRIGMQVAKGLAAAHAQGLIHRDVKPSNILLDDGVERALLTDFGLARTESDACLTRSGFHPGTPHYMSPEQVRGEAIDRRSDLFGLGCVLYAACTGHPPFRAESSYAVLRRITDDRPRPVGDNNSNIPDWLEALVMRLLSKNRDGRFDSAAEVAELLEGCLAHVQQPAVVPLPESVSELVKNSSADNASLMPTESIVGFRRLGIAKLITAACAFLLLLSSFLIVLEWNKGTLRIESDADDVPIRVVQGDRVVEKLIVSKSGKSVSIAAGNYEVEIGERMDGMFIEDGKVTLQRGGEDVVRIVSVGKEFVVAESPEERLKYPEEESDGVSLSTRVYDVSEFVDFDSSISREMQLNTLIGLLQQFMKHAASIDYWPSFHNLVVRCPDSTHDEMTTTLKQLRLCKQQVRGVMSLNAEIEQLQAELSDIPDAERTSGRSKFIQQKIDVAMVTRSEQMRVFQFTLAKLRAEQTKNESADGQSIRQVVSPDHEHTSGKLSQIMKALHRYHDLHKQLPMAAIAGKDGSGGPAHSWRVELLPLLGHQELYDLYRFDEPWDSPHNRSLLSAMPDVYRSPLDSPDSLQASFFAVTSSPEPIGHPQPSTDMSKGAEFHDGGESSYSSSASGGGSFSQADDKSTVSPRALRPPRTTLFWKFGNTRFHNVTDGTSHTIALVEAKREIPWTQPIDVEYSHDQPLLALGGWFEAGWHAAFVDGHVRFFSNSQDEQALRNLLTIDDGQSSE